MRTIVFAAALALAACGGEPPKPVEGPDAVTPRNPFFGTWELAGARVAPWWDEKGETPAADPAMTRIVFAADKSSGTPIVACDKPRYAVNLVTARSLFEGNLPNPAITASELGFHPGEISSLSFDCLSGNRDVVLDFPMVDKDRIMLGLDNVIYTFKRAG